jgi:hypothetical protein
VAFEDRPSITSSSERSEESVRAVKDVLSQKNGFISRDDIPDVGVDLQVELIKNGKATNNRFVVQIKSSRSLQQIKKGDKEFISYTFLTSRLGYLCRHSPGYGLVVTYDDSSSIAYYDFVENIITRLSFRKHPSVWQAQESVNIHIPVGNVLNAASAKIIHNALSVRFANHSVLISQRGLEYGIPVLEFKAEDSGIDFHDPKQVANFVQGFGALLFNRRDFDFLLGLIKQLSIQEIESSHEIRFIVAIAFAETGRLMDADYHLRKLLTITGDLSEEKVALVRLYAGKINFHLGRIDAKKYLGELRSVLPDIKLINNRFSIQLRIDHIELLLSFGIMTRELEYHLISQLYNTMRTIKESKLERYAQKILLLYAAGNLYQLGVNLLSSSITRLRIMGKTFGPLPLALRIQEARRVISITEDAMSVVQEVWESLDDKEKESQLGAHVHYRLASMFFEFSLNIFMLNSGKSGNEVYEPLYLIRYFSAITAYNMFIQKNQYDEAYSAIITAYELRELHDHLFTSRIQEPPIQDIVNRIEQLSAETGKARYQPLVKKYLSETLPQTLSQSDRSFIEMEDSEIEKFAQAFSTALELPKDRIENIIADVRAIKRFKNVIPDNDAELLQDLRHTSSPATLYASPVIHIGRCMRCDFSTRPSTEVDEIVKEYLSSHGESCSK